MTEAVQAPRLLEEFQALVSEKEGEFELAESTARLYTSWVQQLLNYTNKEPEDITPEDMEGYIQYCRRTYASTTIESKFKVIRSFFNILIEAGFMDRNPCTGLRLRRLRGGRRREQRPPVFIPHKDIVNLLEVLADAPDEDFDKKTTAMGALKRLMLQVFIRLLYNTGLRVEEAARVTLKDIYRDRREVYVLGKGAEWQYVKITKLVPFWTYLDRYVRELQEAPDFTDESPLFMYGARWLRVLVKRTGRLAGLEGKVSPHVYRHSFCTTLVRRGLRAEELQQLARHKSITTSMIYVHLVKPYVEESLQRLDLI